MRKCKESVLEKNAILPSILRPADACKYLGIGRTKLHFLHEEDPSFPRKIRLSARCVGWRKASLDHWLETKEQGGL